MIGFFFMFLCAGLICATSEPSIDPPALFDGEVGRYRCVEKKTDRELWTAEWSFSRLDHGSVFACTLRGEGIPAKSSEPVRWVTETVVDLTAGIRIQHSTHKNYSSEGDLLNEYSKTFDFSSGTAKFNRRDAVSGKTEGHDFHFSGDILGDEFLGNFLRGLTFETQPEPEFHLLTSEPKLYRARVKYLGMEEVTVPAGTFTCSKIELIPQLGLLGSIVRRLIPKTYFWFSVAEPNIWVQYEGLESGLNTPHVLMQLTDLKVPETRERNASP